MSDPELLTLDEAAAFLRTTRLAVLRMVQRAQLPGVVRLGRRILIRAPDLRAHVGLLPCEPSNGSRPR